jgi:hypothetical protein
MYALPLPGMQRFTRANLTRIIHERRGKGKNCRESFVGEW